MGTEKHPTDYKVSELFEDIWVMLRQILGVAMTAILIQRVIADCKKSLPKLNAIVIEKDNSDYIYRMPPNIDEDLEANKELPYFVRHLLVVISRVSGNVLTRILLRNTAIKELSEKE